MIHKLEEGAGARYIKFAALVLLVLGLVVLFNWRCYKNFGTAEAMDAAQVGRNLSEGKGFTTRFVRPFSVYLLTNHAGVKGLVQPDGTRPDASQLKGMHPDLANPPVYPALLSGLWKIAPSWWAIQPSILQELSGSWRIVHGSV